MNIQDIINCIEDFAPLALQESYDNSGLIIGDRHQRVKGILICLDVTEKVVEEARTHKCNLIISHHPLIFHALKKITGNTDQERAITALIKNDIALYAAHTNLDNAPEGINFVLANKLGLKDKKILQPQTGMLRKLVTFCPLAFADKVRNALFAAGAGHIGNYDSCSFNLEGKGSFKADENASPFVGRKNKLHWEPEIRIETIFPSYIQTPIVQALLKTHPYEEVAYDIYPLENKLDGTGSGIIGQLPASMTVKAFLTMMKKVLKVEQVRYNRNPLKIIRTVGICSGTGGFLIQRAMACSADAFITSDVRYHDFQSAEGKILLIDAGHYETEIVVKEILMNLLCQKFPNFAVLIAKSDVNPVKYS